MRVEREYFNLSGYFSKSISKSLVNGTKQSVSDWNFKFFFNVLFMWECHSSRNGDSNSPRKDTGVSCDRMAAAISWVSTGLPSRTEEGSTPVTVCHGGICW